MASKTALSYKHTLPSPSIPGCIEQVTEIWVVGSYHCAYIRPMGRYQYMIYEGSIYRWTMMEGIAQ